MNIEIESKKLYDKIQQSHSCPNDDSVQQPLFAEIYQFLNQLPDGTHHFCQSDIISYNASYFFAVLISFDAQEHPVLTSCKKANRKFLDDCPDCLNGFHLSRAKVRLDFMLKRKLPYSQVQTVMDRIFAWESETLMTKIQNLRTQPSTPGLINAAKECLVCPALFRKAPQLREIFNAIFGLFRNNTAAITPSLKCFPGLLYFLFSGPAAGRDWALSCLPYDKLATKDPNAVPNFESSALNLLLIEEFEVYFYDIQNPSSFTDANCITFWTSLIPIMRFCSSELIMEKLNCPVTIEAFEADTHKPQGNFKVVPLIQVFINQLLSRLDAPLPILLRAFLMFLDKFNSSFWTQTPGKAALFLEYFDAIFRSPYFFKYLQILPSMPIVTTMEGNSDRPGARLMSVGDSSPIASFQDMCSWINVLYRSLSSSRKVTTACIIFKYMVDEKIKEIPFREFLIFTAFDIMCKETELKKSLGDSALTFELYSKADPRAVVDQKAIVLFDAANNISLKKKSLKLVSNSMIYDVTSLAHYSQLLSKFDSSVNSLFNSDLWTLLQTKVIANDVDFASAILGSLKNITGMYSTDITLLKLKFKEIKGNTDDNLRSLVASCSKQNKNVQQMVTSIDKIYSRIAELYDGWNIKTLLHNPDCALGFWSSILSPEEKIYESAIGLLYETFDVDGRFEAFKEILRSNLNVSVNSFGIALHAVSQLELFNPTKRALKVLMDFTKCLTDPVHGVLILTSNLPIESKRSLGTFWHQAWSFLRMIYVCIFRWSADYEQLKVTLNKDHAEKVSKDLLEFTRDTLDLSHSLMNGFKIMVNCLQSPGVDAAKNIMKVEELMFAPVLESFRQLIHWLRLSDSALLVLCVDLTRNILDLVIELQLKFDDESLLTLAKLCAKAKKFNNRLTEEQTGELLIRVRNFNDSLVEKVLLEAEEYRKKQQQHLVGSSARMSSSSVEPPSRAELKSGSDDDVQFIDSKPVGNKQKSIIDFMSDRPQQKLQQPAKRISQLDQARLQLNEKRKIQEVSKEPAAPRPAGFNKSNQRKRVDATSEGSEGDSSSDSEEETLFTKEEVVAKMKRTKQALQSLNPKLGFSIRPKPAANAIALKKKAEELMRLRLNVDMNPLYKKVLSWSYIKEAEFPDDNEPKYQPINDTFASVAEYQKAFEPLLLLECWQSIQRAKQISQENPFRLTVGSCSATDSFFDVYASIKKEVISEQKALGDSDLIALMFYDQLDENGKVPSKKQLAGCKQTCLAKVRAIKGNSNGYCDITVRVATSTPMTSFLTPSTEVVGMRVMQMVTIEREFSSLRGLQYYDLADNIVKAIPAQPETLNEVQIKKMKKLYSVNDSQALAIAGTVHNDGFSLIQGPPGTGKTKTILGIIGYVLTAVEAQPATPISQPGKGDGEGAGSPKRKILICAPSNAAVDELVLRLMGGIKNSKGETFEPNIVRLGKSDAVNAQVKQKTLEELVEAQLSSFSNVNEDFKIKEDHRKCLEERNRLRAKLNDSTLTADAVAATELKLQEVVQRRKELGKRLDEAREQQAVSYRSREIERRNIQFKILNSAQVVCSTLSGSAHDVLASMSMTFDTVVIDEAAQCIELSAIIPLRYGCKKCIMVGDPNQLPPTVLSQKAASFNYDQSLFVRMQNNYKDSVYLLDVQYRMHPEISRFPSKEFYNSRLLDGENMASVNKKPWHTYEHFGPYMFYNVKGKQEQNAQTMSLYNTSEAKIALEMVHKLYDLYPDTVWSGQIAVISPYKEQVKTIRTVFIKEFGFNITKEIDFNTVDGFQGQEKEIVLFSCVRATTATTGVGFLADIRRMNVALTRARSSLWILGSKSALMSNRTWKDLIKDAYDRNLVGSAFPNFTKQRLERVVWDEWEKAKTKTSSFDPSFSSLPPPPPPPPPTSTGLLPQHDSTESRPESLNSLSDEDSSVKKSRKTPGHTERKRLKKEAKLAKRRLEAGLEATPSSGGTAKNSHKRKKVKFAGDNMEISSQNETRVKPISTGALPPPPPPHKVVSPNAVGPTDASNTITGSVPPMVTVSNVPPALEKNFPVPTYSGRFTSPSGQGPMVPSESDPSQKPQYPKDFVVPSSTGVLQLPIRTSGSLPIQEGSGKVDANRSIKSLQESNFTFTQVSAQPAPTTQSQEQRYASQFENGGKQSYGDSRRQQSNSSDQNQQQFQRPRNDNQTGYGQQYVNSNNEIKEEYKRQSYSNTYPESGSSEQSYKQNSDQGYNNQREGQGHDNQNSAYERSQSKSNNQFKPTSSQAGETPAQNMSTDISFLHAAKAPVANSRPTGPKVTRKPNQPGEISFLNPSNSGILPRQPAAAINNRWKSGQTSLGEVEMYKISKPKPRGLSRGGGGRRSGGSYKLPDKRY